MKSRNPNKRLLYRIIAFAVSRPLIVLGLVAALTVVFSFFAVRIQVKPDVISLLPEDNTDEAPVQERKNTEENAGEEFLIIAIEGDNIFSPGVLSLYYDVLEQIASIEGIEPGITPFNLTVFEKRGGRLVMGPPVPRGKPPESKEQAMQFREKLLSTRYARNFIVSEDGTLLSAFLPAVKRDSYSSLMDRIREITRPLEELTATYVSGSIPFVERTEVYLSRNFIRLLILAAVIILFMYYLSFRSFRAVLLPTVVVLLGTLWTIGFMSMMGFAVTIITIITPPLVLTLGSSYSIHILNQYYRESKPGLKDPAWITGAVFHVNSTILLASATTIAGILSLGVTTLRLTREFAVATSFGIFVCALLSFLFFPAFLAILKPPREKHAELVLSGTLSRVMEGLGRTVYRFRVLLVVIALGIVLLFGLLAGKLEYNTDTISYFPGRDRVIQDMYAITDKLGGFDELKVVLHAPEDKQNYFLDAEVLEPVSRLEEELEGYPDISYVSSFVSYLKYLNQVMYGAYSLPEKRSLILLLSRYLKTLQDGDNTSVLSGIINPEGTTLTISLRVFNSSTGRFIDERGVRRILAFLEQSIRETIPGAIDTEIQGMSLKYLALSDMIQEDLLSSMLISLAAVFTIAALAYRSLRFGIFTLIPLFIGIMMNFILMVLFRIPLDLLTIMVSSIVIGVGVDDAIHFIIRFRQEWKGGPVTPEVLSRTLQVSGRPIFLTTVSIIGGLAVLLFASFKPIVYFGVLVLVSLSAACVGTLLFLPAFLSFMKGRR